MKSWKTSCAGLGAIVVALCAALSARLDGDPATTPDWKALGAQVVLAIGLLAARDNNKTSEQVGAK